MRQVENGCFYWQETEKHEVRLLRAYGSSADVAIPEKLNGLPVTEIGAYCFAQSVRFAQSERLPQGSFQKTLFSDGVEKTGTAEAFAWGSGTGEKQEPGVFHELSGKYIARVSLPDSVRKIGNCAFYNCTNLKELDISSKIEEIGSDVFMNCSLLQKLLLRAGVAEKSGLKQMLSQISWNIEVIFQKAGEAVEAVLSYPEYYESYDEIGPAHIFELNLTGEGFRARQCFKDGVVSLPQYDAVFPQACVEESEKVMIQFAWNRLFYPIGLTEESKKLYFDYIKEHQAAVFRKLISERKAEELYFLFTSGIAEREETERAVRAASESEWPEGAASLIQWKSKYLNQDLTNRYDFEEF